MTIGLSRAGHAPKLLGMLPLRAWAWGPGPGIRSPTVPASSCNLNTKLKHSGIEYGFDMLCRLMLDGNLELSLIPCLVFCYINSLTKLPISFSFLNLMTFTADTTLSMVKIGQSHR